MRRNISIQTFLPAHLKEVVNEILEKNPPGIAGCKKDKFYFILNRIVEIPAYNKRNGQTDSGFTNLSSKVLQSYFHDYKKYIDYLLHHGIIECDRQYIPGQKSKGYKIAGKYVAPLKPIHIQNSLLLKKIKRRHNTMAGKNTEYKYLQKWVDGLEIDVPPAINLIRAQYEQRRVHPETRTWDIKKKRFKNPLNQYNFSIINIYYLKYKWFYFKVDSKVGRLHTNLTNIQGDLRCFIKWKGQSLGSVDISNCQPYISSKLFAPAFYKGCKDRSDCKNSLTIQGLLSATSHKIHRGNTREAHTHSPLLMLVKAQQLSVNQPDVELFISLVEKGVLYEYLEKAFEVRLDKKMNSRKEVKAAVFQVLYTDNRFIGQRNAASKRVFKELFPHVYDLFSAYKKHDASVFPCLLQQMEAKLVLDIICKRISKEKPNVPIFTIHDSISTTLPNLDYVKSVMVEELTRNIGIRPNLKIEYWEPPALAEKYPELFPMQISKSA